jgi:cell division protein ZapA (FtsZ GTPase activity inhibitor)
MNGDNTQFYEINVLLAARKYPVMVSHNEEQIVIDIAKQLNQQVDEMHARYASRLSKQDILAMLLLTRVKELHDMKSQLIGIHRLNQRLDELEELIDTALPNKSKRATTHDENDDN